VGKAELTHQAICLLSLKFASILTVYLMTASTVSFVNTVSMTTHSPCSKAHTSSPCQIYGQMSAGFGIRSLVTQFYPLSMLMYFLLFNPLLMKFDEAFSSLRLNTEAKKVVVIVYANDWNITLTYPTDIPLLHNIL